MKVIKFGGSSLASSEQVAKVVAIVKDDPQRRFVVVSAPGKRSTEDIKVTDLLIQLYEAKLAHRSLTPLVEEIFARYLEIGEAFEIGEEHLAAIRIDLESIAALPIENNPHLYDHILSRGKTIMRN